MLPIKTTVLEILEMCVVLRRGQGYSSEWSRPALWCCARLERTGPENCPQVVFWTRPVLPLRRFSRRPQDEPLMPACDDGSLRRKTPPRSTLAAAIARA